MAKDSKKNGLKKPGANATIGELKSYIKRATEAKRKKEKAAREEKRRKELLKKARSLKV